jgi:hypothetical protein
MDPISDPLFLIKSFTFIYSSIQVSDVPVLTVHWKIVSLSFRYSLCSFLRYLLASHLTLFRLSLFISLGSCNHCNVASFLWSNNFEHTSLNNGLQTNKTNNKHRGLSPRANYTNQVPTFTDGGCHVVSVMVPYGCNLGFLYQGRYFFFQVAPQLYSQGWVGPVPDPQLLREPWLMLLQFIIT